MILKSFGVTAGTVCAVDDEIAKIEKLVEENKVEYMPTICLEKLGDGLFKSHLLTMGTPLPHLRDILKIALGQVEAMIGKEPDAIETLEQASARLAEKGMAIHEKDTGSRIIYLLRHDGCGREVPFTALKVLPLAERLLDEDLERRRK